MQQTTQKRNTRVEIGLFLILVSLVAFGNGMSDSIYGNYFKEVYEITAFQRGLIEFPRELPGILCAVFIASLSFLGDLRTALIAQILSCVGLAVLGVFTPSFTVMLVFLFINSMGMHTFMPLQDAIGMDLAEPDRVGQRMGQYASVRSAVSFVAAILVFFGFRYGFFSFQTQIKWVFVIGALSFVGAILASIALVARIKPARKPRQKVKFIFRKEYKYYYILATLHGVQKQIAFVYGSWVIIDLLAQGADTMALLTIAASFILIFFMRKIGQWIDSLGVRKMMFIDAFTFIGVYVIYGFLVWGITEGLLPNTGISAIAIYIVFVMDRLSMQIGMVKSVYLRSIALTPEDITPTLSTGIGLDHVVSITAALFGGYVWTAFGGHWVFFMAAAFSLGNVYVATRIKDPTT